MSTTFVKSGKGQVEPNYLQGQAGKHTFAQLPAATAITELENGMFVKYDMENEEINYTGDGEWLMVFNEVKLYGEREFYADFSMKTSQFADGKMYPRCMRVFPMDTYTTNMIKDDDYSVGDELQVGSDGILEVPTTATAGAMTWKIVKIYNLADAKPAVKLQRIV